MPPERTARWGRPDDPLSAPALPDVDLERALARDDPWISAAAIFMARKGMGTLPPQAVIDRWERSPRLWSDLAGEQALLYLAAQPPAVVRGLAASAAGVREALDEMVPPGDGECLLETRAFYGLSGPQDQAEYFVPDTGLTVEVLGAGRARRQGDPGIFEARILSGGVHSATRRIECPPGRVVRVAIQVQGGV